MPLFLQNTPRFPVLFATAVALAAFLAPAAPRRLPRVSAVVGFESNAQLADALKGFPGARIVRRLPHMKTVVVELPGSATELSGLPGISYAGSPLRRTPQVEPALGAIFRYGLPYEWQYVVTRENEVPEEILRAASSIKIAVVDTGLDVTHPDIAAKAPETWDIVHHRTNVVDKDGHGTFVSSLAAGSVDNGEGIAGFGGDAQLLMVKAVGAGDSFSDVDESAAIVYAVDHGANIINLSIGGEGTSPLEQRRDRVRREPQRPPGRSRRQRIRGGQPVEYPAAAAPAGRLERPGRDRPLGRREHDRRQARALLEHGLSDLPRRARRPRLRRRRRNLVSRAGGPATHSPARLQVSTAGRAAPLSRPRGRRRGGARLGRESVADRTRRSPESSRRPHRPRQMGSRAGLRGDRRRRGGCSCERTAESPPAPGPDRG